MKYSIFSLNVFLSNIVFPYSFNVPTKPDVNSIGSANSHSIEYKSILKVNKLKTDK